MALRLLGGDDGALLDGVDLGPKIPRDGTLLGALFEALTTLSVRVAAQRAREQRVRHLRTHSGRHEVDLIVERGDHRVVAIEVKLGRVADSSDGRHLRWLRDEIGDDLLDAVIVTTGPEAYRRQDRDQRWCRSRYSGRSARPERHRADTSSNDVDLLATMLDEDGNLGVIVLERLGVSLPELPRAEPSTTRGATRARSVRGDVVPTTVELATRQVVPATVETHLDDVSGELVVHGAELLQLAVVRDAAAVCLTQLLAVDVRHEPHIPCSAHRAVVGRDFADIAARPQELGVRVADVETGDSPTLQVS